MRTAKWMIGFAWLCLIGCNDDDKQGSLPEKVLELQVDADEVSLSQGDTRVVNILSGNGDYAVVSANEEVVTATVEGNAITLTAVKGDNNAEGVVYVSDKCYQRTKIKVRTAAEFDLKLNKNVLSLYAQVSGADSASVRINTGNGGYTLAVTDESQCVVVDSSRLATDWTFGVKGIGSGNAGIKVTDRKGKEAFMNVNVIAPKRITTDADAEGVLIDRVQGVATIKILAGNGEYKIKEVGDPKVILTPELYGTSVTIRARRAGSTFFTLTDSKGQVSEPIRVTVAPPADVRWGLDLGSEYGLWAHFSEMAGEGAGALKKATNDFKLRKMTWEVVCRIDKINWLQTIIGKEGYFILRGADWENNKGQQLELVGTGDKLKLRTGHVAFRLGEWSHIALVFDGSLPKDNPNEKYKLYVNGKHVTWDDGQRTDIDYAEVDLFAGNDGGRVTVGKASDGRRFLNGVVAEVRIWNGVRSEEQLKANAWNLTEKNPEGLLARWNTSVGSAVSYIEDGTDSDHELPLHVAKANENGWGSLVVPATRFVEIPLTSPFQ